MTPIAGASLRVGTWNLDGRWTADHAALLAHAGCDVWLLTEVVNGTDLPGHWLHVSTEEMAAGRRWAGVLSTRPGQASPDPHPASAITTVDGVTYCSSVLPWRSCGQQHPWVGERHSEKTVAAVDQLEVEMSGLRPLVWGGDWNHAMSGAEYAGSVVGRSRILEAVDRLGLVAANASLPHSIAGLLSIDHVAVSSALEIVGAHRIEAAVGGQRLSDHDGYVVDLRMETVD